MSISSQRDDLISALDHHDALLRDCAAGEQSFADFLADYNDFYLSHALDGHESDASTGILLDEMEHRIRIHRQLHEDVLSYLCSDSDAMTDAYRNAGRIGSEEALVRLRTLVAATWPDKGESCP